MKKAGVALVFSVSFAGCLGLGSLLRPRPKVSLGLRHGETEALLDGLAEELDHALGPRGVLIVGEDHRSQLADAVVERLVTRRTFDCVFFEIPELLQPNLDDYAAGEKVRPTLGYGFREHFGVGFPGHRGDRRVLTVSRWAGARLLAVDKLRDPSELLNPPRSASDQAGWARWWRVTIDERNEHMVRRVSAALQEGTCERGVMTVGAHHVPGVLEGLGRTPALAVVVDHSVPGRLPMSLTLDVDQRGAALWVRLVTP